MLVSICLYILIINRYIWDDLQQRWFHCVQHLTGTGQKDNATHGDDQYCSQKCLKHSEISTTKWLYIFIKNNLIILEICNCGIFTYETMVVLSIHIWTTVIVSINAEQHNVETMMYNIIYCTFNIVILPW